LAIRDRKIHVVGRPELTLSGTPVYLDVEGLPDRGFYYLIGLRVPQGPSLLQHSFWADEHSDEERIWQSFLDVLRGIDDPVIIHYGAYETHFLKRLQSRYPASPVDAAYVEVSRFRKFGQRDKWKGCSLTAIKMAETRSNDDTTSTAESHSNLQSEGGPCRAEGG
jgi:hypothetical protein